MPYSTRQRIALTVVPLAVASVIRLLGATLRYRNVTAPGVVAGDEAPGPSIYAFWHRSLLICAHRFRDRGITILISQSFDGELIARTVELLGFRAVRGSSSRGGPLALRQMARAYREGARLAFTADGPRGPALVAKPGPAQLARLVGAPAVGTFFAAPNRAWTLKTWDAMLIPKPFATVYVSFPRPVDGASADLEAAIQSSLEEAVAMARQAWTSDEDE